MINNLLPSIELDYKNIKIKLIYSNIIDKSNLYFLSKTLNLKLIECKKKIDDVTIQWDNFKKYTNPYEFIHSMIPNSTSISKLKPISRSFYKMIEICNNYNLLNNYENKKINTFHLAEGPGGFIEALSYLRNNPNDNYTGITLISNDIDVPGWKKSQELIKKYKNIYIEYGKTKNGDIINFDNYNYCYNKYKNSMDIITADGGFDFSIDFNEQECISSKLIFSETIYAISLQKKGGTFILKLFDVFTSFSNDIIYLLTSLYDNVNIYKPYTSRVANSERYLICTNFKYENSDFFHNLFKDVFLEINKYKYIEKIFDFDTPLYFKLKLEEINSIIGLQQIESLQLTISLIKNKNRNNKLENLKTNNIKKCIKWCQKNRIPHNCKVETGNIFLNKNTEMSLS